MRRMKMIKKFVLAVALLALFAGLLTACAPATTPAPAAPVVEKTPRCSVTVTSGMGMSEVLGLLGKNYSYDDPALLINGEAGSKSYKPQPNDVIVLREPIQCTGDYIAARRVTFNTTLGTERELSGFQSPITDVRLNNALQQVCEGERRDANLGFDGDIYNGGCNFSTLVKTSLSNGAMYCVVYQSVSEAYDKTVAVGLSDVKWMAVLSINTGSENVSDLCK